MNPYCPGKLQSKSLSINVPGISPRLKTVTDRPTVSPDGGQAFNAVIPGKGHPGSNVFLRRPHS